MSGGAWERVAAYITNGNDNLTTYGGNLVKEDTPSRYRDVYNSTVSDGTGNEMTQTADYELVNPLTGTGKYGDAVYETSGSTATSKAVFSWNNDSSHFPCSGKEFFFRGASYDGSTTSGMFCFYCNNGGIHMGGGFRVVVPVF